MTPNSGGSRRALRARRTLSREERTRQILKIARKQLAATRGRSKSTAALAKAAGVSEAMLVHSDGKRKFLQEAVERNSQDRLSALRSRLASIPPLPPLERIEKMAEATVLACVEDSGNASVILRGLMELPEFAADIYRAEIGATEALWHTEIATHLPPGPLRTGVVVHLAPFAVHACMSFGLWLAALRHKPATAQGHARQYAEALTHVAQAVLDSPVESCRPLAS